MDPCIISQSPAGSLTLATLAAPRGQYAPKVTHQRQPLHATSYPANFCHAMDHHGSVHAVSVPRKPQAIRSGRACEDHPRTQDPCRGLELRLLGPRQEQTQHRHLWHKPGEATTLNGTRRQAKLGTLLGLPSACGL